MGRGLFLMVSIMKIKIKSFNGELPDYLTVGKVYEVAAWYGIANKHPIITDDNGDDIAVVMARSHILNGGSWEIIE